MQTLTQELATQIAADYPTLQSLNLSHNALRDVHHLKHLPRSLTQLDLSANRLTTLPKDLSAWLPELRWLRLRANALESLQPLASCRKLQTLDMGRNHVALVSELRFLQSLAQLRHLSLDCNPLATSSTYRHEVLGMLPQIQSLDGQDVTAAERLYVKLQLKTHVSGRGLDSASSSPAPSPTRLLTPKSVELQQQDVALQPLSTGETRTIGERSEKIWAKESEDRRREAMACPEEVDDATTALYAPMGEELRASRHRQGTFKSFNQRYGRHQGGRTPRADTAIDASSAETKEQLLQSRVEALEGILAVHDKTVKHALVQYGKQHTESLIRRQKPALVPTVETAAAVYTRLLSVWRAKCIALLVQAQSNELIHEARLQEHREQATQVSEELSHCEATLEMWRQRAADFEAQRDLEAVAARQADDQRVRANAKAAQIARSLAMEREKLQEVAENVVQVTNGLVSDKVEQLYSGSKRLEALERRLLLVKERIEVAATLVSHREVRLRNSEAALEAERRVWSHRFEQMRRTNLPAQATKDENSVVAPSMGNGKVLRPATETALRTLFHHLDAYDTGMVRSQMLLQALRRGDAGVLVAVGGPKKLSNLVSHVEAALHKLSLGGKTTKTLTWGEFLLFFMPESAVSLAALLRDPDDAKGTEVTLESPRDPCLLCKGRGLSSFPFALPCSTAQAANETDEAASVKTRKKYKTLEAMSHTEVSQQNAVLMTDCKRLRRLLVQDAHDLQDRVRAVRLEWEAKTTELVHEKDVLLQKVETQAQALQGVEKQWKSAENAHNEALMEVQRLREQLVMQEQEFELQREKRETDYAERLRHEQEIWQTEMQDMRLAHSLLQSDHSKHQVRLRQLERDLTRQKETLLAHETERIASLEDKVRRRDMELARLRRERNTILSSLRQQEQKVASTCVKPRPVESIGTQTENMSGFKQRTVASQTLQVESSSSNQVHDKSEGGSRRTINDISPSTSRATDDHKPPLTSSDVTLRLQKLQSLTESLLAD